MSRTSIVSTGRPQTTDLRALDPSVSPLDAFELDTTNPDAPVVRLSSGWSFQFVQQLINAVELLSRSTALRPSATLAPRTLLEPSGTIIITS